MGIPSFPRRQRLILVLAGLIVLLQVAQNFRLTASDSRQRGSSYPNATTNVPVATSALNAPSATNNVLESDLSQQDVSADGPIAVPTKLSTPIHPSTASSPAITPTITTTDLETNIDWMQAQILDYLNGEAGKDESSVFGGSLLNLTSSFNVESVWSKVHQYSQFLMTLPHNRGDLLQLARRARANLIAYKVIFDHPPSLLQVLSPSESAISLTKELHQIVSTTTSQIYPWIQPHYKSIKEMQEEASSPKTAPLGIVFSTGKEHFEYAVHAILSLRQTLNCKLPIQVQYMGPEDLDPEMLTALSSIPNVETVDILSKFGNSEVSGWAIKPFAMLASSFQTAIFIDADALFFQDPEVLVKSSKLFTKHGQLFYRDRTLFQPKYDSLEWFRTITPVLSKYASTLRYTTGKSHHEMESGVVVIDKSRTDALHSLLLTCQLNSKVERDIAYAHVYGDKETFWFSWEMLRAPFEFVPNSGGTLGGMTPTGSVCGPLFHTDEFSQPLWWNGGLFECKYITTEKYLRFDYAAFDTDGTGHTWEMYGEMPLCLLPGNPSKEVIRLSPENEQVGAGFIKLYEALKAKGWKKYFIDAFGTSF